MLVPHQPCREGVRLQVAVSSLFERTASCTRWEQRWRPPSRCPAPTPPPGRSPRCTRPPPRPPPSPRTRDQPRASSRRLLAYRIRLEVS